ncbi:hypothetical protein G6O67_007806 [Ophiocordyceps sinensis]|uniref:Uncharacterized protein n=1 Tax=Ophiocordyceps sinensis TaxID=72228 RepID=A0A8H4LUP9_9HYPO|nr:hypothetical protein G6O67_007806 [Ophiocordyceps sinensis]
MPWDAVFLCFDLGNKISLLTIVQWIQGFDPLVHILGMKRDLRRDCFRGLNCPGPLCHSCCVSASDAIANARSIRADNYVEVSAKTGENIDELLAGASIEATRRVLARRAVGGGPL